MSTTKEEPNRNCSVGGNGLKLYSNGRLHCYGCNRTNNLPVTCNPERQTAANLISFFTLYLFATESDKSGPLLSCVFAAPMYLTRSFLATHTAIGTHSRFTGQFLDYSERAQLARTMLYDFPVSALAAQTRKAAQRGRPRLHLMASHWPPESFR